jgi:hypothetical protein
MLAAASRYFGADGRLLVLCAPMNLRQRRADVVNDE